MAIKQKNAGITFVKSSGNIYADLGFENPEIANAKADLAILIFSIIKEKKLTQQEAAEKMGLTNPKFLKSCAAFCPSFQLLDL